MTTQSVHLVGIGGIGMSGLAQLLRALGYDVSGSDRALHQPENVTIFQALSHQGIRLFEQDGSRYKEGFPNEIIYSTAIESDNLDFAKAPDVRKTHRAEALQNALTQWKAQNCIAVMGSAGKTTVSAWLGESLYNLNANPTILSGGCMNRFTNTENVGNFLKGANNFFVFEADESDKSVLRYHPEVSIIMNIGTDHYSKEELIEVFSQCLRQTRKLAILNSEVKALLPADCMAHLKVLTFGKTASDFELKSYMSAHGKSKMLFQSPEGLVEMSLPLLGEHNALNALAILATIEGLGIPAPQAVPAVNQFHGVWRRFDFAGTLKGAEVFDDYAHNVEKINSAILTARERNAGMGRLLVLFQPHGFGPLKFMKEPLIEMLRNTLTKDDIFMILPVYYAGGTTSFTPTSHDVYTEMCATQPPYTCFAPETRAEAERICAQNAKKGDLILIAGARDNSLSVWAKTISKEA